MQDLRLMGVHEDGEHLVLAGDDGARFSVAINEPLRAAVGSDAAAGAGLSVRRQQLHQGHQGHLAVEIDRGLRPRDIQALIRAGASAEQAAEQSGWLLEKVNRYEAPIVAEREYVARLAQSVSVRGRHSHGGPSAQTLESRVAARLADRGVAAEGARWDSFRQQTGPWTVVVAFPAGGRERRATWHFDPVDRTIMALDDEARWLSEDEQQPSGDLISASRPVSPRRSTRVYDVEAEGGLRATERPAAEHHDQSEPPPSTTGAQVSHSHGPVDLVTAMRERSAARGRRRPGSRRGSRTSPTHVPGSESVPDDALPLEHISYDSETMDLPPAAHVESTTEAVDPFEASVQELDRVRGSEPAREAPSAQEPEATQQIDEPVSLIPAPGAEQAMAKDLAAKHSDGKHADDHDANAKHHGPEVKDADANDAAVTNGEAKSPPPRPARKGGRPRVPSWDDVMFGARPGTER